MEFNPIGIFRKYKAEDRTWLRTAVKRELLVMAKAGANEIKAEAARAESESIEELGLLHRKKSASDDH